VPKFLWLVVEGIAILNPAFVYKPLLLPLPMEVYLDCLEPALFLFLDPDFFLEPLLCLEGLLLEKVLLLFLWELTR